RARVVRRDRRRGRRRDAPRGLLVGRGVLVDALHQRADRAQRALLRRRRGRIFRRKGVVALGWRDRIAFVGLAGRVLAHGRSVLPPPRPAIPRGVPTIPR